MIEPPSEPAIHRIARMKRMKLAAGGMLAAMAALYAFSRSYQDIWPWLEWLRAFSEAGMVGGLADWFAVTALFRHPLGIPIPHTAVIPREKDRIGRSLAKFVRGNFLTSDRICKQARDLKLVARMASWMRTPEQANKIAHQTVQTIPTVLDALENNRTHHQLTTKLIDQLRTIRPNEACGKLLSWLTSENRYRTTMAPLLVQLANALATNKHRIEKAAGQEAPLKKIPLLGKISKAIAEDISERAAGSVEEKLIAASEDPNHPLWDMIHEQLIAVHDRLNSSEALTKQLENIRDQWLDDPQSSQLAERLWHQLRQSLRRDLSRKEPKSISHLATAVMSLGKSIDNDPVLATNIETVILDGISRILDQHGSHLETMVRRTIEDWDPDTLIGKLEQQVGPDLQFIRINGTLIGGLIGIALHAIGKAIW